MELEGWHLDPWLRHEARYFSAGQPTDLVKDGAHESTDPPPTVPPLVADPPPATLTHSQEVPERVFRGIDFERSWGGSLGYDRSGDSRAGENWVDRLIVPVFTFLRPSRFGVKYFTTYVPLVILGSLVITIIVLLLATQVL
jgi:hypothetical protein